MAKDGDVRAIRELPEQIKQRRYPRMREQVKLLLVEVRRLNWMAVDGHRGFRNHDEAVAEMDAIEGRMKDLVGKIRDEAGIEGESGPASVPDQASPDQPVPDQPAPDQPVPERPAPDRRSESEE